MDDKTIADLIKSFRKFENWNFEEDGSVNGMNLKGVQFINCFLFLNFKNCDLEGASFVGCNMKTADFSGANLTRVFFKNCLIESLNLEGAKMDNIRAIENFAYGAKLNQRDFEAIHDPNYQKPVIKVNSKKEALHISDEYLKTHPDINVEVMSVQNLDAWIDGNKNLEDPVYAINCRNLKENPMDGNHFLTIVIGVYTGKIEDVSAH